MITTTMEAHGAVGLKTSQEIELPFRPPSIRREPKLSANNLRNLYQTSGTDIDEGEGENTLERVTPILPPTPPHVEGEEHDDDPSSSETTKMRSVLVTPVNQLSPLTPDITPPRDQHTPRFLAARPSMASTHAESFKTAQEDMSSDAESNFSFPIARQRPFRRASPILPSLKTGNEHKPSPLAQHAFTQFDMDPSPISPVIISDDVHSSRVINNLDLTNSSEQLYEDSPVIPVEMFPTVVVQEAGPETQTHQTVSRNIPSLRERLEKSQSQNSPRRPSVEKFANIIGWSESLPVDGSKRWSGISSSTIEAFVVDNPQVNKRQGTLRHVSKNNSLRSASSPLPPTTQIQQESSPHRLHHKKAKLSNRHRESFSSDRSRSLSVGSSLPLPKPTIIKVAIIPERYSSLQSAGTGVGGSFGAREHSRSESFHSIPARPRWDIIQQGNEPLSAEAAVRGRHRYYPPQVGPFVVPPRTTSLSAPTSRTTSRANSLTSDSTRSAQRKAENDLRSTLNKMESDRVANSLRSLSGDVATAVTPKIGSGNDSGTPQIHIKAHDFASGGGQTHLEHIVPGTAEWAALRPTSLIATPFSAPSFLSASPEISEARIVSLFPHNNYSIQLIEPFAVMESSAIQAVQPSRSHADSPFLEPRVAPTPPKTQPFTGGDSQRMPPTSYRPGLPEGPSRSNSFTKNLLRTVSLKHARNKKLDQPLDSDSHPMWRPKPFWDDDDARKRREADNRVNNREIVQNSVGIPQRRNTFTGPINLMHRISNRRRNRKTINRQSSYNSFHRLRTGRRLYRISGLGVRSQLSGLKDRMTRRRV